MNSSLPEAGDALLLIIKGEKTLFPTKNLSADNRLDFFHRFQRRTFSTRSSLRLQRSRKPPVSSSAREFNMLINVVDGNDALPAFS